MRIILAPMGSRGDFQPMLALAIGLRSAGHDVLLITSPNFGDEARAFSVPVQTMGMDVETFMRQSGLEEQPGRAMWELFKLGRKLAGEDVETMLPHCRGADLIIGAGAQISARTVADVLRIPYLFVAYTPQALKSGEHAPMIYPVGKLPRVLNLLLWSMLAFTVRLVFAKPINQKRTTHGLAPVRDWHEHLFPAGGTLVAADPELAPLPSDARAPCFGSIHLRDDRPLSDELERFLAAGPPPVYVGFGSMPDKKAEKTTELIVKAARAAQMRLVLSSGWAKLGANVSGEDVIVIGASSHALLFPRVSAVVHHGGAGTTAAALRAGTPQIVVPHLMDQLQWGRWVHERALGPAPIPRRKLSTERLTHALREVPAHAARARALAESARGHDPIARVLAFVAALIPGRQT
jgi:vancomycin aglycone glucosyltransferase